MRALSGPTLAVLNGQTVTLVQLIYLGFSPTPIALNLSNYDLVFGGVTYRGAAGLGTINEVDDSPGEIKGISFQLSGVSPASVALALDDAAVVQGTPCTLRTALLDSSFQIVDAPVDWIGFLDTMGLSEDGTSCSISVTAENSAVDLLRGYAATYSDADQRSVDAGDRGFEYSAAQVGKPVIWPTRAWIIRFGQRS